MEPWNEPDALARQHAAAVYRLAYIRTGSRADAEDIMQEVFLRLIRVKPIFSSQEHAKAWLLRVATNCVSDLFRLPWRKREEPLEENAVVFEEPEFGSVMDAVLSLPTRYRVPIHLHYYEGYSVTEIAAITGKSEGTVKSRLFRARSLLRDKLNENEKEGAVFEKRV